jgi:hypothetical protein
MACQGLGQQIGEQALREAAAVQAETRRARDRACADVDLDLPPRLRGGSCGRPARRGELERAGERERLWQVIDVARTLELVQQRRVHEAAGQCAGGEHRLREARHHRADRYPCARVGVQARELARGQEPGEALVPPQERAPRERSCFGARARLAGADHER